MLYEHDFSALNTAISASKFLLHSCCVSLPHSSTFDIDLQNMSSVLLILGAGANVGAHVARLFRKEGFKIAVVARSVNNQADNTSDLAVRADFSDPTSIKSVFAEVKSKLGIPNVVVYNG
jgi:NADPH:quinone reductase-like Zn-dependent oxidoreductase